MDEDEDVDIDLLQMLGGPEPAKSSRSSAPVSKKRGYESDDSDDGIAVDDDDDEDGAYDSDDNEEVREVRRWGDDLMGDENDRKMLNAMTALDREKFLADRAEKRQAVLDRLELKRKVRGTSGGIADANRRTSNRRAEEKSKASKSLRALKRQRDEKSSKKSSQSAQESDRVKSRGYYSSDEESDRNDRDRRGRRNQSRSRSRSRSRSDSEDDDRYGSSQRDRSRDRDSRPQKLTFPMIQRITITRNDLERWMYMREFNDLVIGCFARIVFGMDPETKQQKYRLCLIKDVSEREKTYNIGSTVSKKQIHLAYGSFKEKAFLMDIVSNQPPTEEEYSRYLAALGTERNISATSAVSKADQVEKARNHTFTNAEVEDMIAQKKTIKKNPTNIAAEKILVIRQLDQARSDGHSVEVDRLERRLEELDELAGEMRKDTAIKLDAFAKLNARNRERGYEEARKAEIEMKTLKLQQGAGSGADGKGSVAASTAAATKKKSCNQNC
ncbi:hypothetical protein BC830DRAFT_1129995 [Chytriomyces sp. MP71]|nr:hypothetical protein BC830DRAFT_1129995 [Chytriomyces sp. MP71]